jgi:hypothetical protein
MLQSFGIPVVLVSLVAGLGYILHLYVTSFRKSQRLERRVTSYKTGPRWRTRSYLSIFVWIGMAWVFIGIIVPRAFSRAAGMPTSIGERVQVRLSHLGAEKLEADLRSATMTGDTRLSATASPASALLSSRLLGTIAHLHRSTAEYWEAVSHRLGHATLRKAQETLWRMFLMAGALVFLSGAAFPRVAAAISVSGWRGLAPRSHTVLWLAWMVAPGLVLGFVLDRAGVSTRSPIFWLVITGTVMVAEALLARSEPGGAARVYVAPRGRRYHCDQECPGLRQSTTGRVIEIEESLAVKLSCAPCSRCSVRAHEPLGG